MGLCLTALSQMLSVRADARMLFSDEKKKAHTYASTALPNRYICFCTFHEAWQRHNKMSPNSKERKIVGSGEMSGT